MRLTIGSSIGFDRRAVTLLSCVLETTETTVELQELPKQHAPIGYPRGGEDDGLQWHSLDTFALCLQGQSRLTHLIAMPLRAR